MDARKLVDFRKQAEKAVEDMPDGELKVKAFEVILAHLLGGPAVERGRSTDAETAPKTRGRREGIPARSLAGRILVLRDEGFFKTQRAIGEVREELTAHGWHYPLTTLSGRLQAMVQHGELRREKIKQGKKKVWKYSNP